MIQKVTIKGKNIKEPKHGEKNGKAWTMWPVGINTAEHGWINSAVFSDEDKDKIANLKDHDSLFVEIYDEEYQGNIYKKFRLPKKLDLLELRIIEIEKKLGL